MKKILSILLVFALITSGFAGCVSARDSDETIPQEWIINSWGQKIKIENGSIIVYNQTVVVSNTSMHINILSPNYVVYKDCTVTVNTNGRISVINADGDIIMSNNGLPFRFCIASDIITSPHYTNEPTDGAATEDVSHNDFLTILADDLGSSMAPYYKTQKNLMTTGRGIVFTDDNGNRYRGVLTDRYVSNGFVYWSITFTSSTCPTIYDFVGRTATDGVNLSVGVFDEANTGSHAYYNVHSVPEGQTRISVNYDDGTRVVGCICM